MRICDVGSVIRSQNAGLFTLTIDLIFGREAGLQRVLHAPAFGRSVEKPGSWSSARDTRMMEDQVGIQGVAAVGETWLL